MRPALGAFTGLMLLGSSLICVVLLRRPGHGASRNLELGLACLFGLLALAFLVAILLMLAG